MQMVQKRERTKFEQSVCVSVSAENQEQESGRLRSDGSGCEK